MYLISKQTLKITPLDDDSFTVFYISPKIDSYYYEANSIYKHHKISAKKFLKKNKLKLNKKYKQEVKPIESLIDYSHGLSRNLIMVDQVDSVINIPRKSYAKIIDFYESIIDETTDSMKPLIAGSFTSFDIKLKRQGERKEILKEKYFRGWYDIPPLTKEE